ncbi:MAG TPA: porin family protein [Chryseolinea sp.]|nr:porin family protein [Chryseolinea sp.]
MQFANVWNKLYLRRYKVIAIAVLMLCALQIQAQKTRWVEKNNPNYDNRKLTYGFLIGIHSSIYQIKYSDKFVTPALDTVSAVLPSWSSGFSLGFIVNYRLTEFLDLRLTPEVAFYENKVRYQFTNDPPVDETVENTIVEFPILLKYKSERRGNIRMYMVGGVKPGIEASGKKNVDQTKPTLEIKETHLNLEAGFGFDLYYPLFKFSPEIRFSRGLLNMLGNTTNEFGQPLQRVNTNTITLYLLFQ